MRHKRMIASLILLAGAAPATQVFGQSTPQLTDDPAELFGYSVDVRETESRRIAEQALDALAQVRSTAQETKMVFRQ
tara:strand:- start:136 stop:366 length:231 start_codon:yes stop_codon:yes gene_type:complete